MKSHLLANPPRGDLREPLVLTGLGRVGLLQATGGCIIQIVSNSQSDHEPHRPNTLNYDHFAGLHT